MSYMLATVASILQITGLCLVVILAGISDSILTCVGHFSHHIKQPKAMLTLLP